ncbi:hypothetical protein HDV06_006916 [Boothiomyces sp. JEL0866]|nr:hypothetical protein HDV06_006916 [Boothiomyces sp. JEL0866]
MHQPNTCSYKRHAYYDGTSLISLHINPDIVVESNSPCFFYFTCNSNIAGNLSFKIIGTETVMNKKAEDHVFLKHRYKVGPYSTSGLTEYKYPINCEGMVRPVKSKKGTIKYSVQFYLNKILICTTKLNVIIPRNLVHKHIRKFVDSANLLFSIEGSRILFLHSEEDTQFLISPFRPRLVVVGIKKVTQVRYSVVEKSEIKVRYKRSSWEPSMNILQKEDKCLIDVKLEPNDFDAYDGMVSMPLEIIRLEEYAEPDVKGNYINIHHYMQVHIRVEDGDEYNLKIPLLVIAN